MRRRYIEINKYNSDLLSAIKYEQSNLEIINTDTDIVGVNPLHPMCFIHWRFKNST